MELELSSISYRTISESNKYFWQSCNNKIVFMCLFAKPEITKWPLRIVFGNPAITKWSLCVVGRKQATWIE